MLRPGTLCAALSSLSEKPVIFGVTDFVLLLKQNVSIDLY